MNIPFSTLLSLPNTMTWFIDQCYELPKQTELNQSISVDFCQALQQEQALPPLQTIEAIRWQITSIYQHQQAYQALGNHPSETELSRLSEQLYHCTKQLIFCFKYDFKQGLNDYFYQKIRWVSDAYLHTHLKLQWEYERKIAWPQARFIPLTTEEEVLLSQQLIDAKQKYLKRLWFFCVKPFWMEGLEALKQALFFLFPHPTLKWAIAYALYEENAECFKDAHQTETQPLGLQVWTGIARVLSQSNTLKFFQVLLKGISSVFPDLSGDLKDFCCELSKNIFQRELMTQHIDTLSTQQAIELLQIIDHPILLSLILNKLNAQKPSPIQYTLVKQIFPILKHPHAWLQEAIDLLNPQQKQFIGLLQEKNSPLFDMLKQQNEHLLFSFFNVPKKAFLQAYLSRASQRKIECDADVDEICLSLIQYQPNQFFKVLISLPLDILKDFLNEKILAQLGPTIIKSYLQKLMKCLILNESPKIPLSQLDEKAKHLITPEQQRLLQLYIQLIDAKLIKNSLRDQRAILLFCFEFLSAEQGASLFLKVMSFYQPSILNARRLRRCFELCIRLKKIGLSFGYLISFIDTLEENSLKGLYEKIEYFGRESLFKSLNLSLLDHREMEEDQSILDHPFLPMMLSLHESYAGVVRLVEVLKASFIAMICGKYKEYKYQALEQHQSLKLSATQKHIWVKQQCLLTAEELINQGLKSMDDLPHLKLRESDDYMEILEASVSPIETCLSWRNGMSNRSLLSFMVDPHLKLVRFELAQRVIGRAFWRLSNLSLKKSQRQMLALVIEPIYAIEKQERLYEAFLYLSLSKAKQMHIAMVAPLKGYETTLFDEQREKMANQFGYQVKKSRCLLSLIGSITGYELSDTLSCFDVPQALNVEAEVFLFEPNWWGKINITINPC